MKKIGVLTSGGDAPGMNACIRSVVRTAMANNVEILGIRRGYAGLIAGDTSVLDRKSIANIVQRGRSFALAEEAKTKLKIESKVCVLGHIQRGGSPTAHDRVLASNLGSAGVSALLQGKSGVAVGQVKNEIVYTALADTWGKKKELSPRLEELARLLSA